MAWFQRAGTRVSASTKVPPRSIICLWAVVAVRDAPVWGLPRDCQYWIVLLPISLWDRLALFVLMGV